MSHDLEHDARSYTGISVEQMGELLKIAVLFMQANGLSVGLNIMVISRDGVRTAGNLTPVQQHDAFKVLSDSLASSDFTETPLGTKGAHGATH